MKIDFEMIAPPFNDNRWRVAQMTMRQYGNQPNALIETMRRITIAPPLETSIRQSAQRAD